MANSNQEIALGGGCHWCTEAVFQALHGVSNVAQGFVRSTPPDDKWSEAVVISFDETEISLSVLIEIHLRTHSSNSPHKMRGKYRSAIYVYDNAQRNDVKVIIEHLRNYERIGEITRILDYVAFKPSEQRYHNYYQNAPDKPFCKNYIDPKLKILRSQFMDYIKDK